MGIKSSINPKTFPITFIFKTSCFPTKPLEQTKLATADHTHSHACSERERLETLVEQQARKLKEAEEWCGQAEATKNKLEADISSKDLQLSTLESRCQTLSAEKDNAEASLSRTYQAEYQKMEHRLEEATRRCQELEEGKQLLEGHFKKLQEEYAAGFSVKKHEYESMLAQQAGEINSLRADNKSLAEALQVQMAEVKKHYEAELERANNEAKRLRAEIGNKSGDLETSRNKARLLEQKQSLMDAELEANKAKLNDLNGLFEKEKQKNLELSTKMLTELTEKV